MNHSATHNDELYRLLDDLCDGLLSQSDAARLDQILLSDKDARREYLAYLEVHAGLALTTGSFPAEATNDITSDTFANEIDRPLSIPPIVVAPSPWQQPSGFFAVRSIVLSYSVSAVVVVVALLIGWTRQVSNQANLAQQLAAPPAQRLLEEPKGEAEMKFVGRITAAVDCQWANPVDEPAEGAHVPLGREFVLSSGLLEISYDSGAAIILQGPCNYRVQSPQGGFLSLGQLTVRVEKNTRIQEPKPAEEPPTLPATAASNAASPTPLFTVRTPTAIITDLGTEFGVKVERSGASRADVFRGKVQVRLVAERQNDERAVELEANQSAQVVVGSKRGVQLIREPMPADTYVRRIPKRVPIKITNTGIGLKDGDLDKHWLITARSDNPKFTPQPAVVAANRVLQLPNAPTGSAYVTHLPNQPSHSQWISLSPSGELPNQVIYTFRTTLNLTGLSPKSAVLQVRYLVDDQLKQVRLNGRVIEIPPPDATKSFIDWQDFKITQGFVEGLNILEIDVFNEDAVKTRAASPMLFRAELEGSAIPSWSKPRDSASETGVQKSRSS